jgi:hypothetical protein
VLNRAYCPAHVESISLRENRKSLAQIKTLLLRSDLAFRAQQTELDVDKATDALATNLKCSNILSMRERMNYRDPGTEGCN